MNLVFCDLRKFPDLPQRALNVRYIRRLRLIGCHIVNPGDQRPHLAQDADATVCPLGKVDGFLAAK